MSIVVKETERKEVLGKKTITLKDIVVSELTLVDEDGENLTDQFLEALPDGTETVTLKVSLDIED